MTSGQLMGYGSGGGDRALRASWRRRWLVR
jgi:hypothetical protein